MKMKQKEELERTIFLMSILCILLLIIIAMLVMSYFECQALLETRTAALDKFAAETLAKIMQGG